MPPVRLPLGPAVRAHHPNRPRRPPPRSAQPLGCVVVRRITDDLGRGWRVREFRTHAGTGLLFRCEVPGVRAEVRALQAPLEWLDDEELAAALRGAED